MLSYMKPKFNVYVKNKVPSIVKFSNIRAFENLVHFAYFSECLLMFTQTSIIRMSLNVRITRMHIYANMLLRRGRTGRIERALNPTDAFSAS